MHALVVYESMYGNTRLIAEAIARGLTAHAKVDTTEVAVAPAAIAADIDLLVVGGPTHAFGMSRRSTREDARRDGAIGTAGTGIREWIDGLARLRTPIRVATFDTKVAKPRLPGSAARSAQRKLRRLGFTPLAPARTFLVEGKSGPLLPGQEDAATGWGEQLSAGVVDRL